MAGQQNYLDLTIDTYKTESIKYLKESSEKYFLKKRFGISQDIDRDKLSHYQMVYGILASDETELIDWIDKKIKGTLGTLDCCSKPDKCCYGNIDSCSVNKCLKWEKVEW